jgi:hypothetical protein
MKVVDESGNSLPEEQSLSISESKTSRYIQTESN